MADIDDSERCAPTRSAPDAARWPGGPRLANRLGYLCFAIAIVTFVIGFIVSFNATVSTIVIASMIVGSVLLAPAIVLGYAVKAAERDDRERGL